jgi:cytochrome c553
MKKVLLIASLFSFVYAGQALSEGDAGAGKTKSAACAACHGADGNSVAPNFPKLAGQNAPYLHKQLADFKSGKRVDPTMTGMVAPLSDADMADLAAYFATQTTKVGSAAKDQVELGQMIYRSGNAATGVAACAACHGPTGAGNPQARFPKLSGQHADYVVTQLKRFAAGERANDPGSMMRVVAHKMNEAEMKAVAQYVQGLH